MSLLGSKSRSPSARKQLLLTLIAGSFLSTAFFWNRAAEGPIVIYLVDTLRQDRMSVYGGPRETTPAAAALAKEGVLFTNAFTISTWTRPSVANLLTSLLPAETMTLNRFGRLDESVPYLPELLQKKGWNTAAFVGNGNIFDTRLGFQRGFAVFRPVAGDNDILKPSAPEVVDPAIRFIESQQSPHFFLFVHVVDPHVPYNIDRPHQRLFSLKTTPAQGTAREELLRGYDRAIREADDQFERITAILRTKSWWDSATVVYTSDHGEEFFEHGDQGHGRTLFEEQVRIPLIIKYPRGSAHGQRRNDPVTLSDVTPTLAKLGHLAASPRWLGGSLLASPFPYDRELYSTEDLDDVRLYGMRRGSRKVIVRLYPKSDRTIYQLDQDPNEQAGRRLECQTASPLEKDPLLASLGRWRSRDIALFPALELEKVRGKPLTVDLLVNLGTVSKPFLTAEDDCRFAAAVRSDTLELRQSLGADEPFRLRISADDWGNNPIARLGDVSERDLQPVDFQSSGSPFRITRTVSRFVKGLTSDEVLRQLRALGYLGGSSSPVQQK